jgi:hypothetical protein
MWFVFALLMLAGLPIIMQLAKADENYVVSVTD